MIDLRHPWEVERSGRLPHHPSLAYHNLSIEHRPYDQAALGPDVEPARYPPHLTLGWPAYGRAPAGIMSLFMAELAARYGSVRGYAAQRLGVDDELVSTLRGQLLTP
ncbi:tyrosine-protein phosphatase [Streptomyces abikoensis]|uniref:tyrosine-protein phosphatase n=1 Tax=Streptomyces TaxID=1883 RepID=UPI001F0CB82E|nr:tyrosine-protein phosphatase [Streptomyces luteoverticillatus]